LTCAPEHAWYVAEHRKIVEPLPGSGFDS